MKKQAIIHVGIFSRPTVEFEFNGTYSFSGKNFQGSHSAYANGNKVVWDNAEYDEVTFEKGASAQNFVLKKVTIGVDFHWQRDEDQVFDGNLRLIARDGKVTAVNVIGVEDYLLSVISSEMSATASKQLLKAHSVISRSWLLAQIEKNKTISASETPYTAIIDTENELIRWQDREDHTDFDVCADDHCQRYQGLTRGAGSEKIREIINETWGEVLTSEGAICDARFSKCCGGAFEEFQYCWEDKKYPYLVGQRDSKTDTELPDLTKEDEARKWILSSPEAFCNTTDKDILSQVLNTYDQETLNFYRWKEEYSQEYISDLIHRRTGTDYGQILDLVPIARGTSGRLWKLKIVGSKKTRIIGKELEIRHALSESHLYSSAFVVEKSEINGGVPGKFTLIGAGWGHGVGLCQIGAAVMGAKGYPYDEILYHYYPTAKIEKKY